MIRKPVLVGYTVLVADSGKISSISSEIEKICGKMIMKVIGGKSKVMRCRTSQRKEPLAVRRNEEEVEEEKDCSYLGLSGFMYGRLRR